MKVLRDKLYSSGLFTAIKGKGENYFFTGVSGSLDSFIISFIFGNLNKKIIYCSDDITKLFHLRDDLSSFIDNEHLTMYLSSYDEEYESELSPLSSVLKKLSEDNEFIIVTDPEAFRKKIISEKKFRENIIRIKVEDEIDLDKLIEQMVSYGYKRKKIVEEENDFAVRGGIMDIYPENMEQPVRLEFFGNTIESIREFDLATQRSINKLEQTEILPPTNDETGIEEVDTDTLIDYIKDDVLVIIDQPDIVNEKNDEIINSENIKKSFFSAFSLQKSLLSAQPLTELNFNSRPQPAFSSNLKLLFEDLKKIKSEEYKIFITAVDDYQAKRFRELIDELDDKDELSDVHYFDSCLHGGFIFPAEKTAVYTDHEVFGRYFRTAKRKRKFSGMTFKDIAKVNNGDFMVHQNYGIGKYAGLHKIKVAGVEQEAVKLIYQDNDMLFVNLNALHLIKKYSAQEGHTPKTQKLGGSEWDKIKQKTKKRIQDIAKDLILLYSKRKSQQGYRFSRDSVWQKELEASFIYEDTPDQISATEAIKTDMESEYPMDRLVCGDVGFGKTEVAVRAAFKCVLDNKQCAILVPTTILAEQHYNTFRDRLSNWAVEVEHLSRFKTKKEQTETLEKLKEGKINIVIGTHRLLSNDVSFKDLGLLIIDEEQRFGVKHKEKIKMMRINVDVLTLTATPIPRTLNFSMLGARDLSIINTPPKNRQPIHTEIINFDKKIVTNAIIRELQRGGQVYFVNDKIAQLEQFAYMIEEMIPFAKVVIAHGQMKPSELEKVMMGFMEKKFNVLVCTKIIESGLDIPSVNTIVINRSDNFGLAELYQLRGRVGRSNIKSYAYLIAPPQAALTKDAVRRLHALEEFTELGSGLNLALRDLEIRGAGNLLGAEQSGFINEIGFDMYMQLLDEAVREIKEQIPGKDLKLPDMGKFAGTSTKPEQMLMESDISAYIPEFYIEDENTRLEIYQKLSALTEIDVLHDINIELIDRFGKLPEQAESLMKQVEMKILAIKLGFERISINGSQADLVFNLKNEELFRSGKFQKIAEFLNLKGLNNIKMIQTREALILRYTVKSHDKLTEILKLMNELNNDINPLIAA